MRPHSKEPEKTVSGIWAAYEQFRKIFERNVSFGHPNHPIDPADVSLAGNIATSHNGLLDNIHGSWVEVEFTNILLGQVCYHNLDQPILSSTTPNVRWLVCGIFHDSAGTNPQNAPMSVHFNTGTGIVTRDTIVLQMACPGGGLRVINADHPAKFTLFFTPAVRG